MYEELNRKLLKWTGVENIIAIDNGDMIWKDKEGIHWYLEYFTDSMDSCFNRLVPEIKRTLKYEENDFAVWKFMQEWLTDWILHKKEPALALCQALEQLIKV